MHLLPMHLLPAHLDWRMFTHFSCVAKITFSDRFIRLFFLSTFSAKSNLWKAGNLSFWIFNLSFYKSLFSKSDLFWQNLTWVLQKMGWFSPKIAKTWVFFRPEFFAKWTKKKPGFIRLQWISVMFSLPLRSFFIDFLLLPERHVRNAIRIKISKKMIQPMIKWVCTMQNIIAPEYYTGFLFHSYPAAIKVSTRVVPIMERKWRIQQWFSLEEVAPNILDDMMSITRPITKWTLTG